MTRSQMILRRAELRDECDRLLRRKEKIYQRIDEIAKELDTLNIELQVSGRLYPTRKPFLAWEGRDIMATTSRHLSDALSKEAHNTRTAYAKLTDEQKQTVEAGYQRHVRACEKAQMKPQPGFLFEIVSDVKRGRYQPV